jgi:hypothetical protein
VSLPAFAQQFDAVPAVVRLEHDAEQVSQLAIKITESGLGPAEDTDPDVALCCEPLGEDAQRHRLAGAGSASDEGETAFAGELLGSPAERFDARCDAQRLDRHVRGEGIPLEAIEREQLLVHLSSPCSSLGR